MTSPTPTTQFDEQIGVVGATGNERMADPATIYTSSFVFVIQAICVLKKCIKVLFGVLSIFIR